MTARNTLAAIGVFAALAACSPANNAQTASPSVPPPAAPTGTGVSVMLPDFSKLVETHGIAVVNISTVQNQKKNRGQRGRGFPGIPGVPEDDPLQEFFRRFMPEDMPEGHPSPQSLGSGFILKPDGLILTNAHVVDSAEEVTVRLTDKREFKAKIIGADKRTDIAVLKIDAKDLPTVPVGNPENLKVGEWVLAIGSPFGFDNTVTAGIVSAKGRSLPDESYVPFIQTDVAVNPGNSGGPLFNMKGEVIGINSQIYSRSGGYMGISFAIPIDMAMKVADQLQSKGKVSRGKIGVVIQEVNSEMAKAFGLDRPIGAMVSNVEKGSPADKAGIQAGDIVIRFEGKAVQASRDLPAMVGQTAPGTKSKIVVWRDKKEVTLEIQIGVFDAEKSGETDEPEEKAAGPNGEINVARFGLTLGNLNAEQKKKLGTAGGALIVKAEGNGRGLRPGDVILAAGNPLQGVQSASQLAERLNGIKKGNLIPILVQRGEQKSVMTLQAKE